METDYVVGGRLYVPVIRVDGSAERALAGGVEPIDALGRDPRIDSPERYCKTSRLSSSYSNPYANQTLI
jgi:hypothetical protein